MEITTFGSRVRSARLALADRLGRKVTQEDLAREVGLYSGVVVSRWEKDHGKPHDPDVLVRLADVLGVTTDWLLRGEPHVVAEASTHDTSPSLPPLPPETHVVARVVAKLEEVALHVDELKAKAS